MGRSTDGPPAHPRCRANLTVKVAVGLFIGFIPFGFATMIVAEDILEWPTLTPWIVLLYGGAFITTPFWVSFAWPCGCDHCAQAGDEPANASTPPMTLWRRVAAGLRFVPFIALIVYMFVLGPFVHAREPQVIATCEYSDYRGGKFDMMLKDRSLLSVSKSDLPNWDCWKLIGAVIERRRGDRRYWVNGQPQGNRWGSYFTNIAIVMVCFLFVLLPTRVTSTRWLRRRLHGRVLQARSRYQARSIPPAVAKPREAPPH